MKKILKWTGIVLGSVLVLVLIAGVTLYTMGSGTLDTTYAVTPKLTSVPSDSASVARGEHLAKIHACMDCHGENLEGRVFLDIPPFMAVSTNLTPGKGGIGQTYSDADWDRAIRHGVKPDGKSVLVMPSVDYHDMSDDDTAALIAYLKSVPPVDNELPATEYRPPIMLMAGAGAYNPGDYVNTAAARASAPTSGPTAEYGAYLASITCQSCHGEDLHGGESPNPDLPGPDLAAAGSWSFEDFAKTMRTGVNPDGRQLPAEFMPWTAFQHMTADEMTALHEHLKTLTN